MRSSPAGDSAQRPGFGPHPWIRFQIVGTVGAGVHLGVLFLGLGWAHLHYLAATLLAVESALIHNFAWHQTWTWRERPYTGAKEVLSRLVRFHCANGMVSLVGNAVLMRVLMGELHIPGLVASGISIISCCLLNFLVGDKWVFRTSIEARTPPAR